MLVNWLNEAMRKIKYILNSKEVISRQLSWLGIKSLADRCDGDDLFPPTFEQIKYSLDSRHSIIMFLLISNNLNKYSNVQNSNRQKKKREKEK